MAISILGPTGSNTQYSGSSMTIGSLTVVSGTDRIMLVSSCQKGNSGEAELSSVTLQPVGGGTPVATFTQGNDIVSDNILHSELWYLLDDDFPSNGTYDVVLEVVTTAQAMIAQVQTFQGVAQQAPDTYGATATGNTTLGVSSVVISVDGSLVTETASGDDTGASTTVTPDTPPARDYDFYIGLDYTLSYGVGGTYFDTADSPLTLDWTWSNYQNRLALSVVVMEPSGAGAGPKTNVMQWGANF